MNNPAKALLAAIVLTPILFVTGCASNDPAERLADSIASTGTHIGTESANEVTDQLYLNASQNR